MPCQANVSRNRKRLYETVIYEFSLPVGRGYAQENYHVKL